MEDRFGTTQEGIRRRVRRLRRSLHRADPVLLRGGASGHGLKPTLVSLGVACIVIAPSLPPVPRPGGRIKADRRDALKRAELLAAWFAALAIDRLRMEVRAAASPRIRSHHR